MVLHKNKWDRKATRAHVRKLKAKGKEDDTKKDKSGSRKEEGGVINKQEFPKLPGGAAEDEDGDEGSDGDNGSEGEGEAGGESGGLGDENGAEEEEGGGGGGGGGGQFNRRKMQSNAWRYEQEEEEEPVPGEGPGVPEPEPDYVAMTKERKGQLKDAEAPKGELDEAFLKDLQAQRRTGGGGGEFGGAKGKVIKVDRKQFEDVTTKIAKQSTADAFRQRFAPRKAKPRGAGGGGDTGMVGPDEDDVDSFLGELKLDEVSTSRVVGSREISGGLGRSRTSEGYEHDQDDDWLDSMLGGR